MDEVSDSAYPLSTCTIKQSHSVQKGQAVIWAEKGPRADRNSPEQKKSCPRYSIRQRKSLYLHGNIILMKQYFT